MMKDGDSLRFPTFPADSPLAWRNEMHQHFVAQDAARRSGTGASAVLVNDGSDDAWALHRPGPRYLADATARNAANAELAKAYAEYDADQSQRWRGAQAQGAEFVGAREGLQCTVQGPEYPHDYGSPGHLRRLDGRLICACPTIPSRVDRRGTACRQETWRRWRAPTPSVCSSFTMRLTGAIATPGGPGGELALLKPQEQTNNRHRLTSALCRFRNSCAAAKPRFIRSLRRRA
jgi:hypothetical protein